jgi:YidC/Oxa1 family membrane protein insertase
MFEIPAELLSWFYGLTSSYIVAIALIAIVVMAITTPLTLKSTKGMLEMQRVAPDMRKLQNEYRNDKQKLNEEMMKLYQEHKVNPMSSCLPIAAQMPIFLIMFRVLRGLVYQPRGAALPVSQSVLRALGEDEAALDPGFIPRYLGTDSALYEALFGQHEMMSLGLDLSRSAFEAITDGFGEGIVYALLVVFLGGLYFGQQKMVAARAAMSPTMSVGQQKLMQYLPVFFAVFQVFFLAALVVYYIFQTLIRIVQQLYITKAFYGHDEALGRQAQRAGEEAREEAKKSGEPGGMLAQAKRELSSARGDGGSKGDKNDKNDKNAAGQGKREIANKRVTPAKGQADKESGQTTGKGRPTPSRQDAQDKKNRSARPKTDGKRRR